MAYAKRKYNRKARSIVPKKPFRYEVADMAATAYEGVQRLKRLINVEIKHYELATATTAIPIGGSIYNLSAITQGDTSRTRDGSSIKPQYFQLRGTLQSNGLQNSTSRVRVILFRGIMENGVAPVVSDLLREGNIDSLSNMSEKNRFTVLSDRIYSMQPVITGSIVLSSLNLNKTLQKHIKYTEISSAAIENGGVYLLVISDQPTNEPYINMYSRVTFTDN